MLKIVKALIIIVYFIQKSKCCKEYLIPNLSNCKKVILQRLRKFSTLKNLLAFTGNIDLKGECSKTPSQYHFFLFPQFKKINDLLNNFRLKIDIERLKIDEMKNFCSNQNPDFNEIINKYVIKIPKEIKDIKLNEKKSYVFKQKKSSEILVSTSDLRNIRILVKDFVDKYLKNNYKEKVGIKIESGMVRKVIPKEEKLIISSDLRFYNYVSTTKSSFEIIFRDLGKRWTIILQESYKNDEVFLDGMRKCLDEYNEEKERNENLKKLLI